MHILPEQRPEGIGRHKVNSKPVLVVEGIKQQHPQGAIRLASGAGHLLNDGR